LALDESLREFDPTFERQRLKRVALSRVWDELGPIDLRDGSMKLVIFSISQQVECSSSGDCANKCRRILNPVARLDPVMDFEVRVLDNVSEHPRAAEDRVLGSGPWLPLL
jgi:hypothetical protein